MGSEESSTPKWVFSPPSLFDIVTGFYPETKPEPGGPKLRPCLVLQVKQNSNTGQYACKIAYGTKNLKTWLRRDLDVIIQNTSDLDEMGLPMATRFVLDEGALITLPWSPERFSCWSGYSSPRIGALSVEYQKEFAFIMMRRLGQKAAERDA